MLNLKLKWNLFGLIALLAVLLPLTASPTPTQAQEEQCFEETGLCVSGRILQYWQQNGGLPVFGLPITEQREETIGDWTGQVQWFERNRLELHPENEPPYDVLLGRLGGTFVERDGGPPPREEPREGCTYFEQTGYNVCGDFLNYWGSNGLNLDGQPGFTTQESLALFGFPLTGEFEATLEDGNTYTVQWFERARFERHPENPPPFNVLLSRLGVAELQSRGEPIQPQPGTPSEPQPAPVEPAPPSDSETPSERPECFGVPESRCVPAGSELTLSIPVGEPGLVTLALLDPPDRQEGGSLDSLGNAPPADENGVVTISLTIPESAVLGRYTLNLFADNTRVGWTDFAVY